MKYFICSFITSTCNDSFPFIDSFPSSFRLRSVVITVAPCSDFILSVSIVRTYCFPLLSSNSESFKTIFLLLSTSPAVNSPFATTFSLSVSVNVHAYSASHSCPRLLIVNSRLFNPFCVHVNCWLTLLPSVSSPTFV